MTIGPSMQNRLSWCTWQKWTGVSLTSRSLRNYISLWLWAQFEIHSVRIRGRGGVREREREERDRQTDR